MTRAAEVAGFALCVSLAAIVSAAYAVVAFGRAVGRRQLFPADKHGRW